MTSDPSRPLDLGAALSALPLFPLPQAVLFPGAVLPLHVFEPRYKKMIRDCLSTHRALSVVQITDPATRDEHGHPVIAGVAGVGVIVDHMELSDGRYNILVRGIARARLDELPYVPPYRTARATILPTEETHVPERDVAALVTNLAAVVALIREREKDFEFRMPKDAPPGLIADVCAHYLLIDAGERQAILETFNLSERVLRVTELLALQRLSLSTDDHRLN